MNCVFTYNSAFVWIAFSAYDSYLTDYTKSHLFEGDHLHHYMGPCVNIHLFVANFSPENLR